MPAPPSTRVAVAVDAGLAVLVLVVALSFEAGPQGDAGVVAMLAAAAAAGLARTRTLVALALIWVAAAAQLLADGQVVSTALGVVVVGYGCGRQGGRLALSAGVLSVPAGAAAAVYVAREHPYASSGTTAVEGLVRVSGLGSAGAAILLLAVLGAPVVVGLLVRVNERYRVSRDERDAAEAQATTEHEIAQSRAHQTRLARDVHDVVGHSLAVIIAQADAARLSATDDDVRAQLEQIATVGRSSLAEVRDVLQRTDDAPDPTRPTPELDELIAGVRSAGHEVNETSSGTPRPLPGDVATAAYRVLQELLTNALKHGESGTIDVEREWTAGRFTLRVGNPVTASVATLRHGMGLSGVRDRVESVGGTVRVIITAAGTDRARVVATAHVPVP